MSAFREVDRRFRDLAVSTQGVVLESLESRLEFPRETDYPLGGDTKLGKTVQIFIVRVMR